MLGKYVSSDLELHSIAAAIPFQTEWGSDLFTKGIQDPSADRAILKRRQLPLLALRNSSMSDTLKTIQSQIQSIVPFQSTLNDSCMQHKDLDPRILESFQQVVWSPESSLSFVNPIPRAVQCLHTWKSLVLPGLSIVMPLLAILLPFVVLRFLHGPERVTTSDYMQHVKTILLSQITIPSVLRAKHSGDVVGSILETVFIGITIATFLSGMWNQYMAAVHLRVIGTDVGERGTAIGSVVQTCKSMLSALQSTPLRFQKAMREVLSEGEAILKQFDEMPTDPMAVFGFVWNKPEPLRQLRDWIGTLDVYVGISSLRSICFPSYSGTSLALKHVHHPLVKDGISNNGDFTSHVLLTGPNRGGKSTFCKAVGLAVICAQTWGFAWASSMSLQPFVAIETALSPADELGRLSLFEAEIEFAKGVLERCDGTGAKLVMMDEIFHSTNAHDGVAASRVFLDKLYDKPDTTTLISTHYRELVDAYKSKGVLAWAMDATETPEGLKYSYTVVPGISDKSSVMEILKERGLVPTEKMA
jgi:hypothetical protein